MSERGRTPMRPRRERRERLGKDKAGSCDIWWVQEMANSALGEFYFGGSLDEMEGSHDIEKLFRGGRRRGG